MSYVEFGQILAVATGVLLLILAGYGLSNLRFQVPGTGWFVALSAAAAFWCLGYTLEWAQVGPGGFQFAATVEYCGLAFIPTCWLFVALSWIGHPAARSKVLRVAALSMSVALAVLVGTNDLHHWWYAAIVPLGHVGIARYVPGPLYYCGFVTAASPFVAASVMALLYRRHFPHFRQKAGVILMASLIPLAVAVAFQLGFRPGDLDPTIFSLLPTFLVIAWGLFVHDFIRIVPIARESVVESVEHPILVHDTLGTLVDHNAAARPHLKAFEDALRNRNDKQGEVTLTLGSDRRTFGYVRSPLRRAGGMVQGSVVVLTDLTEEKKLLATVGQMAGQDPLTGVANLRHFEDHALAEISRASRHGGTVAIVLFDLDSFRTINARFGSVAGDRVLGTVVDAISNRLRSYDLLARIGSDRFAILLPEAHPVEAREAAERWRSALEATPHALPGSVLTLTGSFGVATLNELPITLPTDARCRLNALQELAEKALSQAKVEGRNRVI
jgi:diguanylate cyclase (GGDEF)-like protein